METNYQYQIQPLPAINVIGGDFTNSSQISNTPIQTGNNEFTTMPNPGPGGGGSGGGGGTFIPGPIELELCDNTIVSVYGYVNP